MMMKYRVSDVAKDFGKPNKEIAEILGAYLQAPKSNAQALKEPELDVIFEYLTQKNQAESLDALFAPAAEASVFVRNPSLLMLFRLLSARAASKLDSQRLLRFLNRSSFIILSSF